MPAKETRGDRRAPIPACTPPAGHRSDRPVRGAGRTLLHRRPAGRPVRAIAVAAAILLALVLGPLWAAPSGAPVRSLLELRQHNVVLQQWDLSCGAAALATVLRYQFGEPLTEREVALGLIDRPEYYANPELVRLRQGFSLLDLKRFVDAREYQGVGLGRLALSDLVKRAPVIVPVHLQGFPHFVVFRGAAGDRVLLADPAFGNVTITRAVFVDAWIEYAEVGRVGFVVHRDGDRAPPGRLRPRPREFVMLR